MTRDKNIWYVSIDSVIIWLSIFLGGWLRPLEVPLSSLLFYGCIIWLMTLHTFYLTKQYRRLWVYASIRDFIRLVKSTSLLLVLTILFIQVLPTIELPISYLVIMWMVMTTGMVAARMMARIRHESTVKSNATYQKVLIVGAGKNGSIAADLMKYSSNAHMKPVAFIDDEPRKQGQEIHGIPIVGRRSDIPEIVEERKIDIILIAIPTLSPKDLASLIEIGKQTSAQIKKFPNATEILKGNLSLNMIREINVEDLLGRDPVDVDLQEVAGFVTDKVVLITGAGGSIGSELCRQIAPFKPERLLLLGAGENSIYTIEQELKVQFPEVSYVPMIASVQDEKRIDAIFSLHSPDVVFHAAAHKHVPLMESNPREAIKNNVFGTRNLAKCADRYHAERFVLISTDKAVNPTSIMGTSKRIAEMIIQSMDQTSSTKFSAVRFGNVLGSRGSVIPFFKKQIREGGPVTVTHPDMVRYFMTIPEAVQLVIQSGAFAKGGEIFILDMGEPVKIYDLAKDLILLSGFAPHQDIDITFTGIRPGEKLYEEIFTKDEALASTKHELIFVASPGQIGDKQVMNQLKKLEEQLHQSQDHEFTDEIKQTLLSLVPTFEGEIR